ncbi:MAG: hypothetical protein R3E96_07290 [Planctomycetota bacterium]
MGAAAPAAFQPEDTLAQVAKDHNILDINDMIRTIVTAQEARLESPGRSRPGAHLARSQKTSPSSTCAYRRRH